MKEVIENVYCDICHKKATTHKTLQVIFTTEQTEGRPCKPYLSFPEELDLCNGCLGKIMNGNYVIASGAQGYNNYYFKKGE